jgi:hypothetical protein
MTRILIPIMMIFLRWTRLLRTISPGTTREAGVAREKKTIANVRFSLVRRPR